MPMAGRVGAFYEFFAGAGMARAGLGPAKESHRGVPIPSWLHEDVQDVTVLIHSAPQVLLATLDRDEHLVEMPGVSHPTAPAPQLPGPNEPSHKPGAVHS